MNEAGGKNYHPLLVVLVNDQSRLEYDRSKPLSAQQLLSLDHMDQKMDAGIRLGPDWIEKPDPTQRAKFVAVNLIEALQQNSEGLVAASCAYLANRLPALKQVKAKLLGGGFSVELVFDKPYVKEATVDFIPRSSS